MFVVTSICRAGVRAIMPATAVQKGLRDVEPEVLRRQGRTG